METSGGKARDLESPTFPPTAMLSAPCVPLMVIESGAAVNAARRPAQGEFDVRQVGAGSDR